MDVLELIIFLDKFFRDVEKFDASIFRVGGGRFVGKCFCVKAGK